jgi:hypothetical protein
LGCSTGNATKGNSFTLTRSHDLAVQRSVRSIGS